MLVELTGLPGSGKTALAGELARLTGGIVGRVHGRRMAVVWAARFIIRHPLLFSRAFLRTTGLLLLRPRYGVYVIRVLIMMSANTAYARSLARTRLVFCDEGFAQFTLSEARKETTREVFARRIRRLPKADFSLHLEVDASERQRRLARRTQGVPRYYFERNKDAYVAAQEANGRTFAEALRGVRGEAFAVVTGLDSLASTARECMRSHESQIRGRAAVVLPEYQEHTASHFAHTFELFHDASHFAHLSLAIERGVEPTSMSATHIGGTSVMRFARALRWMRKERREGTNVLYVHYSFFAAFVGSFIFPRVYLWNCGEAWKYPRGRLFETFTRSVMRRVIVVTGTENLAGAYVREYGLVRDHMRVLPNSINLSRFTPIDNAQARMDWDIPEGARVITFIHRLSPRKGAHHISPILRHMKEKENIYVLIAGEGPYKKELMHELKDFPQVRFLGGVANTDVPSLLAATDVLMMPSDEEGFPRVLLEAMAMGAPFVASDVGAVKEITPPEMSDFIVPAGDEVIFAQKLDSLLTREKSELSPRLEEWVRQYDLPLIRDRFLRLLAGEE